MIKKGYSFLILYTKDLDTTEKFYTDLGIKITERDERKLVFTIGDFELHFNNDEPIKEYSFILEEATKGGGVIFSLEVDTVDYYYTKLQTMDANLISPINSTPWNTREFMVNDPNGYHIVFWEEI